MEKIQEICGEDAIAELGLEEAQDCGDEQEMGSDGGDANGRTGNTSKFSIGKT